MVLLNWMVGGEGPGQVGGRGRGVGQGGRREGGQGGRMLFPSPDSRGGDVVNGHPSVKM